MMRNARCLSQPRTALHLHRLVSAFPFDAERIRAAQLRQLRARLADAVRHAFYRERFRAAGLADPRDVHRVGDLRALPLLTREDLRRFVEDELARDPAGYARWFRTTTSGSTGAPLTLLRTWPEQDHLLARFLRAMFLNGLKPWEKAFTIRRARVSSGPDLKWDSWVQRLGLLRRPFARAEWPVAAWADAFRHSRADVVYGSKSYIVRLAIEVLRQGAPVRPVKFCLSAGEVLDPTSRALLESAFGHPPVIEVYGCTEMSTLAFQEIGRDFLWWASDVSLLELVDRDPARPDVGTVVVTDLRLRGLPLIRYVLGDRAEAGEVNGLPVVRRVLGRDNDSIPLRDGSVHNWLEFDLAVAKVGGLWRFRIIQEDLDRIRVLALPRPEVDRAKLARDLTAAFEQWVARGPRYEIEFVDDLPPDPSGKIRMVMSKVQPPAGVTPRPA